MIDDESSNGIVGAIVRVDPRPDPHFLEEGEETRAGRENSYSSCNSIKLFLFCRAGPVYPLAYQDGPQREHKEQSWGRGGRDGGGFARDFVTSGRCFIDLNPLTGGTLRGYSPIVFTARDALEISSSRPPPSPGERDLPTYGAL